MSYKYPILLIAWTGVAKLKREEQSFTGMSECYDYIFENKITDYKIYKLFEAKP